MKKKNESLEKTETSERVSDPSPADAEAPKGESKEEKKHIASLKAKKSVPARRTQTAPASVAKPTLVPVDESTPVPVDEPASLTPVTAQPAGSSSDKQPVDGHGSSRVKLSTHGLRQKTNRTNLGNGANDLSLRKDSRLAAANAIGETASAQMSVKIDSDLLCFLGFGVGMTIAGVFLGYWTWRLLCKCIENPITFMCQREAILLTSIFVTSFMLAWSLFLGVKVNGRQGFLKTFKGWLITMIISIIVLMCIGVERKSDLQKEAREAEERIKQARAKSEDQESGEIGTARSTVDVIDLRDAARDTAREDADEDARPRIRSFRSWSSKSNSR